MTTERERDEIPEFLAENLPPEVRKALQHPCRRHILRALLGGRQRKSSSELTRLHYVSRSLAETNYHVSRLYDSGLVGQAASEVMEGSVKRYFWSLIDKDKAVLAVLKGMERRDQLGFGAANN